MHIPNSFKIKDEYEALSFVEANGFGQLISNVNHRPFSTHIPFLLSENSTKLLGHVAASNPQHSQLNGQEVLVTFSGPHGYISPTWYNKPGVPTWNYQAVHIYGFCNLIDDADELKNIVDSLTHKYETGNQKPWQPQYDLKMLKAIVGFDIEITEIQCQYKLNQNRSDQDRARVIKALEAIENIELASAMSQSLDKNKT